MWDLSSPTRDPTCTPCTGSAESRDLTIGPPGEIPRTLKKILNMEANT